MKAQLVALSREREEMRRKLEAASFHSSAAGATSTGTKKVGGQQG
jgi:hypothetical protein